jgi:hypothetical protein
MPGIAHSGRARISLRRPRAMAECDISGFWYGLDQMRRQFQWSGNQLVDTGLLVGPDQLDVPQDQYRAPILPPDPVPRFNPRPSPAVTPIPIIGQPLPTSPGNLGFSQYTLGPPQAGLYPVTKAAVLAQVASLSGIPTPGVITDHSTIITAVNTSIALVPANPARVWLLLYNPAGPQAQLSLSAAVWGGLGNLILGPGEAYFWATAQALSPVYQGAVALIGLSPAVPFYAWDA